MTWYCFKTLYVKINLADKYIAREIKEKDGVLFNNKITKLLPGVMKVSRYLSQNVPLAEYICIEKELYRELRKEARGELKKQGIKPTEAQIRDYILSRVLENSSVRGGGNK